MEAKFSRQRQFPKMLETKFLRSTEGIGIRHQNKYTNNSFKRSIVSFYRRTLQLKQNKRIREPFMFNTFPSSFWKRKYIALQTIIHLKYRHHLIYLVSMCTFKKSIIKKLETPVNKNTQKKLIQTKTHFQN